MWRIRGCLLASIFPVFDPTYSTVALYAVNSLATGTLDISSFQATVVSDANSLNGSGWLTATGATTTFGETVLAVGATSPVYWGSVAFNNAGWLKIDATVNGTAEASGFATPEPYTAPLLGAALIGLWLWRRKWH